MWSWQRQMNNFRLEILKAWATSRATRNRSEISINWSRKKKHETTGSCLLRVRSSFNSSEWNCNDRARQIITPESRWIHAQFLPEIRDEENPGNIPARAVREIMPGQAQAWPVPQHPSRLYPQPINHRRTRRNSERPGRGQDHSRARQGNLW